MMLMRMTVSVRVVVIVSMVMVMFVGMRVFMAPCAGTGMGVTMQRGGRALRFSVYPHVHMRALYAAFY
jgi:hypothetical protein